MNLNKLAGVLIPVLAVVCLLPWVSSGVALLLGIFVALFIGNPYAELFKKWSPHLLSISVIGLGAGMNLHTVAQVGFRGIGYTMIGLAITFSLGVFLGRLLKLEKNVLLLVTMGTAICGGSAIAALSPVIRAKSEEVTVSLVTVFFLNAVALFLFPWVGHQLSLGQAQFGLWSALAIHDTSSVVGATLSYGALALEVGTSVKLARALWIVPLTFTVGYLATRKAELDQKTRSFKKPWFILGFLLMSALVTYVPGLQELGHGVESVAKRLLVLTLFLIGANLSRDNVKKAGFTPFLFGFILWIIVASLTLTAIYFKVIA